jgi:hypothetical protein
MNTSHPSFAPFKCPICASHYFGPIFEKGQHVGRYCKGWPSGVDRSYNSCRGKHEERFGESQKIPPENP